MSEPVFIYMQKVVVNSGFFRGHSGVVRYIKKYWWNKLPKYWVVMYGDYDHHGTRWYEEHELQNYIIQDAGVVK